MEDPAIASDGPRLKILLRLPEMEERE